MEVVQGLCQSTQAAELRDERDASHVECIHFPADVPPKDIFCGRQVHCESCHLWATIKPAVVYLQCLSLFLVPQYV